MHARYQGPYIFEKKINELDYVIQTPDRHKSSQLCHINMMKEYHGRDVVDNAAVAVVSTKSVCDDLNEKSCSDFFARVCPNVLISVPESARMHNCDVLSNLDSKLSHLSAHERQILSNLFSEHPDIFSDNPGCTSTIVRDINIGEANPIKQHPYRINVSKLKIVQDEIKYLLTQDKIETSYSD